MSQREVATCRDKCRYGARVKTDDQRRKGPAGELPVWLRAQRMAPRPDLPHGWKEAETVRRLEAAVPGVSFGAYRDIEAGNRPVSADQLRAIEIVFGAIPDFTSKAGSDGDTSLPAAYLERIDALVDQLNQDRALIRELLRRLAPPAMTPEGEADRVRLELEADTPPLPQPHDPVSVEGQR